MDRRAVSQGGSRPSRSRRWQLLARTLQAGEDLQRLSQCAGDDEESQSQGGRFQAAHPSHSSDLQPWAAPEALGGHVQHCGLPPAACRRVHRLPFPGHEPGAVFRQI